MARQMKDSGVEWIGKIPEGWNLIKGRYCYKIQSGFPFASDNFSVTKGFPLIRIRDITSGSIETFYDGEYPNEYIVNQGDFLIGMDGDFNVRMWSNRPALLNQRCCRVSEYKGYERKYLFYILPFYLNLVNQLTYSTTVKHLSVPDLNEADIPSPSLLEQQRIASFLDKKCSAIDDVLAKTQESIEEYKKLKQAVITEAVTKGVRGKRPMKDSGIDWIGQIPKEWGVQKFGHCVKVKANLVSPDEYLDLPQIAPDNIEKGSTKLLDNVKTVRDVGVISDNHLFRKGQILYSKIRPLLNKVIIAPYDGLCCADMYPLETKCVSMYIVYTILSHGFEAQVGLMTGNRVKMPKINKEELYAIFIALPPYFEQQEIADYLNKKCAAIDTLISKKQLFIEELTAYKKSLIYEYVTGKKEVPA